MENHQNFYKRKKEKNKEKEERRKKKEEKKKRRRKKRRRKRKKGRGGKRGGKMSPLLPHSCRDLLITVCCHIPSSAVSFPKPKNVNLSHRCWRSLMSSEHFFWFIVYITKSRGKQPPSKAWVHITRGGSNTHTHTYTYIHISPTLSPIKLCM